VSGNADQCAQNGRHHQHGGAGCLFYFAATRTKGKASPSATMPPLDLPLVPNRVRLKTTNSSGRCNGITAQLHFDHGQHINGACHRKARQRSFFILHQILSFYAVLFH